MRRNLLAVGLAALGISTTAIHSVYGQTASQPPAEQGTLAAAAAAAVTAATRDVANADIGSQIRFKVEKFTLPNGLTVLLHEDHSVPIISYHTWFRVGSKNEEPGLTGIAHLFEHMMFKGAKRYTGEQFDTVLQANGATNNAFTTQDYTGYYENLPSAKLELIIDVESDRLENLRIDAANLKSEREVVKEERRLRVENSPMGVLREALMGSLFRVHPYRWPVIGSMADLDNVTVDIAQNFHRTYYAPNNAVVVVAGDFDPAQARRLIEKYYGAIKAQELPKKTLPKEPDVKAARVQFVSRDVQNPQFILAYHTPKAGADDAYALDLLANIMGSGTSSRLHQRLVYKEQVATAVGAWNWTLQDSGMFQIYVSVKPGGDYKQAERVVRGEMWRPANLNITEAELQKAKNQVMKSYVDGLKTVHGKAEALAINEILYNDYEQLFKDLDRYSRVTAAQIKTAARKYLDKDKSTLVVLRPNKAAASPRSTATKPSAPTTAPSANQGGQ